MQNVHKLNIAHQEISINKRALPSNSTYSLIVSNLIKITNRTILILFYIFYFPLFFLEEVLYIK